jgi:amino acid transporter
LFFKGFTSIVGGLTSLGVSARVWSAYFDALFDNKIRLFITEHIIHWPNAQSPFTKYPDLLAFSITIFLIVAMLAGLKNSKYLTNSLTVLNMSALFFIGITGFILGDIHNYQPFMPFGVQSIFRGSSLLLYSYIGFEIATVAIEEAKNPSKIVPQATVISLLIVTLLYSLAGASLTYLIPYKDINKDSAFAHAYELSKWPWARYIISIAIVFSAGGNLLSGTYGTIRIMLVFSIIEIHILNIFFF